MNTDAFAIYPDKRAIVTKFYPMIENSVTSSQTLTRGDKRYLIIPHRPMETVVLRNLGFDIPAPILSHYDWNGAVPFESQKVTAAMMVNERRGYVLNGMGTGKTLASLFATDYLIREGVINKVLVVAPLSTLSTVWENEIFRYMRHRSAVVLHSRNRAQRLKLLAQDADYYIINHDGVATIVDELRARGDINAGIVDELTAYRNKQATRWKRLNAIVKDYRYLWGMTGSPIPKEPTDAFGQLKLITPKQGPKFFGQFQRDVMQRISTFRWIPYSDANETVFSLMQPAVRFSIEDCVDLPPTTYTTVKTTLSPDQKKAYRDMVNKFVVQVQNEEVEAANSGVQAGKLLQIGAGFVYDEDGKAQDIPEGDRYSILVDLINEAARKVIVFAPYRYTVKTLAKRLADDGFSLGEIHGGVSKVARDNIFGEFQNSDYPKVLVAHPKTMSHGLTLTQANTIIWFSPMSDLEIYEQANARIVRPSQRFSTNIVHIEGGAIEKRVYSTLSRRGDAQAELLSIFHEMTKRRMA